MSSKEFIGRNLKIVRSERGLTQREVAESTHISISQLSAYENGKQMPGLITLANLAITLGTSIDRLYFGNASEAFLNETTDLGMTVVNCFLKLRELGVVNRIGYSTGSGGGTATLLTCSYELYRMFSALDEYEHRKDYYPDGDAYLSQIYRATANEINGRHELAN